MKNFNNICLIVILFIFVACGDENKPPDDNNNNDNVKKMTALINGNEWKADSIYVASELGTHRKQLRIFGIKGLDSIELILQFEPSDSMVPGTYNFSLSPESYFIAVYLHAGSRDTASEGTVILSKVKEEYPEIAVGTYNFIIKNNQTTLYTITEGAFDSGNSK